jgi:hypothetical protein
VKLGHKRKSSDLNTGTTLIAYDWVGYVDLWKWFAHEVVMADSEAEGMTASELQSEKVEQIPLTLLVF